MAENGRAQYRGRSAHGVNSANIRAEKSNTEPSYTRIIMLELFLCVLILLSVLAVKQFGGKAMDVLKASYQEIVGDSTTGQIINENLQAIQQAAAQTFSSFGQPEQQMKQTGMDNEMPVCSFIRTLSARRMRAPAGTTVSPIFVFGSMLVPVEGGSLSCGFGYRIHPITHKSDFHTGIDIAAPRGTRIMAALSGTVKEIKWSDIYGNTVVLDHGASFYTIYSHCEKIVAPLGARLKAGETIAFVGDTGLATGPHLHFEMQKDGLSADPMWVTQFRIFDTEGTNVF